MNERSRCWRYRSGECDFTQLSVSAPLCDDADARQVFDTGGLIVVLDGFTSIIATMIGL